MYKAEECKYAKSHEWVHVDGDIATVGISDHAQKEISDIVFVELPEVGKQVEAGKQAAVVESVKSASDFYAPVSGEVVEVNEAVKSEPSLANQEAHGKGYFFKIKLSKPEELDNLMSFDDYKASL
ncbi:MAG: glycine cleavage system protein GcvH [Elusimicrobiaceae bacterium]|jgi:glycine cleavage system H protein|nr:glycine cleavage system protein GcvH [Elusimicrobiaceae bacterium]MBT4403231.1 glycine cleavage system protein GcvH [Elusimicrobiaceae bacterium]